MDITTQAVVDTAILHLKSADGQPLYSGTGEGKKPVRVIVWSPGSDAFAQIETRQTQRAMKRREENDGKPVAMSAEERLIQNAEDLADVTVAFENLSYGDKTGRELALAVYGDRTLGFIGNQVGKFIADWGNFKRSSPTA